jgi:hypothetical protein
MGMDGLVSFVAEHYVTRALHVVAHTALNICRIQRRAVAVLERVGALVSKQLT